MVWHRPLLPCLFALSAMPASASVYCCTDEHGKRVCGDILPVQCQTRAYNEFNQMGVLKKAHEAPLTPEQRAQRDAELARKKAEDRANADQVRRDKAMLASYNSVADIDAKRTRTVAAAKAEIKATQERIEAAQARQAKLKKSVERYTGAGKAVPDSLTSNLREGEADLAARRTALADKEKELLVIEENFDHDRRRFIELTAGQPAPVPAPPAR